MAAAQRAPARPDDMLLSVQLDYGIFRGAYSAKYNITYWTTLPFSAPPVGMNRFRAPQPVLPANSTGPSPYNCSRPFPMCPQREDGGDEDCLYLGLYGRPWTDTDDGKSSKRPLRPVVVVFFGGGFIRGSAALGLPPPAYPTLNVTDQNNDLLFVYPNYRTNAFGFLSGRQVGADPHSDTNAGLLDQQTALQWVQQHIRAFGGDPEHVSIWGQSAGGGSVVAQVVAAAARASGRSNSNTLFHHAMANSPYWPKTHRYDSPASQEIYDDLAERVGCTPANDTLACLKAADVQTLRTASLAMTADRDATATSSYVWAPVLDDSFLTHPLSSLVGKESSPVLSSAFATYNTHEGENLVPPWLFRKKDDASNGDDEKEFHVWLARYLPDLAADDVAQIDKLYPSAGDIVYQGDEAYAAYSAGSPFGRAGLVYRDVTLSCPAYWMTGLARSNASGWMAEYSIAPAKHAGDTYWWNTVNKAQTADPTHYRGYAGAIASFLATGDPNEHKLTAASVTSLPDRASGQAWTVTADGFSTRSLAQLEHRCSFWLSIAPRISV
ncbi:hypothetical protein SCUCBS95973_005878 [Sporothrix curviconia]|uniref:Carboxylic ester hydrolase n=1 Tax=Sporothrix curviconia TaxID=1260050 RepID=A0ABP0C0I2_9PEZI